MANLIIKNGWVVDPLLDTEGIRDIFVSQGKLTDKAPANAKVIDAKGKIVCPGLIDMHVHLREPGQEEKETILTGSQAAAKGGFTSICCMPNTQPPIDKASDVEYIKNRQQEIRLVNIFPIACITKERLGKELSEMNALALAGAVAFSDDGGWVENANVMRRAIEYAQMFNRLIISHCEDSGLSAGGVMNEGALSTKMGLRPIPNASESIAVSRDILLAEHYGPVHLAHISTKESVALIRAAKKKGVPVTAETAPHYFCLTDEAVEGYNTNAKVNPPLRSDKDVQAIIKGLQDGTIDAIATDHAPHTLDDKRTEFDQAAFGISGLETAFSLGFTTLVTPGKLTLKRFISAMTCEPAKVLQLKNKGSLQPGNDADIVIIDPEKSWTVRASEFVSKGKNTPFDGWELTGVVTHTILGGRSVYECE